MKKFSCGDVVPGCHAAWVRETDDEILTEVADHASLEHGLVTIPDELVAAVRAQITAA